jgi:adenine deaminase
VYKAGELVAKNGSYVGSASLKEQVEPSLLNTINTHEITENQLQLTVKNPQQARIIEIIPNSLITKKCIGEVDVHNGQFAPSITDDLLKLVVVERHHKTGNVGLGVVRGFGLTCGAIATTIAHDSHNIVATGTNDNDIIFAIQAMKEMNGGLVVVKDGQILASLALPIGGLMSQKDFATVNVELKMVKKSLNKLGFHGHFNPFLTLSFLTLPVIPELKLTDLGLFDMDSFKHIDV